MATNVNREVDKMDRVVEAVIRKQGSSTNVEIAKKLGITESMWGYLKSGQRQPGKKFYSAVMREYPELIPTVLMAMTQGEG